MDDATLVPLLKRIAKALDRLMPPAPSAPDLDAADAYLWEAEAGKLHPVSAISNVDMTLLRGVDHQRGLLLANTRQFAQGLPANNALLWGARGMGKSSLIKAVHQAAAREFPGRMALVEIHREDLASLSRLLRHLRESSRRFVLFCDDLSFTAEESSYKSLKAVLEGGIEGRPANVIFYATSNRRHLMPREMIDNENSTAINPSEAVEEKISLSDRFGLWLGFHACDQETYLAIVDGYARWLKLPGKKADLHAAAIEWAITRGGRSGRVAWQFIQDAAGKAGVRLP